MQYIEDYFENCKIMKKKSHYVCTSCGAISIKWTGQCGVCGEWETLSQVTIDKNTRNSSAKVNAGRPVSISEIDNEIELRIVTGIKELDRVLGGGIIPGSIVLVGGDPGIGKSTLMLQMAMKLKDFNPLYITGEESLRQIRYRADRISTDGGLMVFAETNIESIAATIESSDYSVIVIDSIQSMSTDKTDATPGSIIQIRECASLLMGIAKKSGKSIFLIGHVTKEGYIAGPKVLEHMVDTVLQFEGEKTYSFRILRALKNRYGSTNEIGIFRMEQKGLEEVENASDLFLVNRDNEEPGTAIVSAMEGTRPILLEVQALVTNTNFSVPQRTTTGYDTRRLQMILAVLEKRLGIPFQRADVFVNVAGGIYMNDPSLDLGIAAALVSSHRDIAIKSGTVIIGEIGLTGEVRPVSSIEQRIKESEKLGFKRIILPGKNMLKMDWVSEIKIIPAEKISLVLGKLFS